MNRSTSDLVETTGPIASRFGILSPAVTVIEDTTDSWIGNFVHEVPDSGITARNRFIMGGDLSVLDSVSVPVTGNPFQGYYPFDIETTFKSSTFGVTPEWVEAQAVLALDIVAQKAIEHEFWTGALAKQLTEPNNNRYLASSAAIDVTPTPGTGIRTRHAQALLEQALGDATVGSAGTIHAPRAVASALHLNKGGQDTLLTKLGNTVVAGSGYTKTGPNGSAVTGQLMWMYATGPVTVRIGAVSVVPGNRTQAADISQNTLEWYANRPAAVTWSTENLYAVLVDLSLDYA